MPAQPHIEAFFDETTFTVTYLVGDPATREAVVIDPVLDFDPASGRVTTTSADRLLASAAAGGWTIGMVLETHAHADHLSSAKWIKAQTGALIGIGEHIGAVQDVFRSMFAMTDLLPDAGDFDRLLADGDHIELGELEIEVIATPGHTAADISFRIGDAVFVGDTMFMPDYGTARTDFPGGDAATLYRSIRRLLAMPRETRLLMCHDYKAPGRDHYAWETTVGEERAKHPHVKDGIGEDEFVAMREARDAGLSAPLLLMPSIQVNIRAGKLPPPDVNGVRYLKIPVKLVA